ncbi:hypothetical protein FMUBM48_07000 [Nocardia cyriacigeorgica]|nr:hypothetical protein FMUBM48_07000 [Nocardia cyriacigeorgica]
MATSEPDRSAALKPRFTAPTMKKKAATGTPRIHTTAIGPTNGLVRPTPTPSPERSATGAES